MRDLKSYRGGGISRRYENTYVYRSFFLRDLFRKLTLLFDFIIDFISKIDFIIELSLST